MNRQRINAYKIGIAIRYGPHSIDVVGAVRFLDELIVPVAHPDFAGAGNGRPLDPADLPHDVEPWDGAPADAEWAEWFAGVGAPLPDFSRGRRFSLTQLAIGAALDGVGIAIGRFAIVLDELHEGWPAPIAWSGLNVSALLAWS